MTETLQFQPEHGNVVPEMQVEGQSIVGERVAALQDRYPNVDGLKHPGLVDAATEIVREFSIKPEFFEGENAEARTLILSSFAFRYAELPKDDASVANIREKEFIADGVLLLAKDFTDDFKLLRKQMDQEAGHDTSDGNAAKVIDKFTNRELSEALEQRIQDGFLDDIRKRMQITPDNEDKFEIHAISVGGGITSTYGVGRDLPEGPTLEEWRNDRAAAIKKNNEIDSDVQAEFDWKRGLEGKGEHFLLEYGANDLPDAFVATSDGRKLLTIAAPLAEKIAYNDDPQNRRPYYNDDPSNQEHDDAVLRHEYAHTQGGLTTAGVIFGIGLEERRAEYFSGDKLGYQDIKAFFSDLRFATGYDILDYFDKHPKGGIKEELYADIASKIGLASLPEVLMAVPRNYLENQASEVQRGAMEYMGGYQGVIGRLFDAAKKDPEAMRAVESRIEESAQIFANSKIDDFEFIRGMRKSYGSVHFIDQIIERAVAIRQANQRIDKQT